MKNFEKAITDCMAFYCYSCQMDCVAELLDNGSGRRWHPFRKISSMKLWQDLQIEIWEQLPGFRKLTQAVYVVFKGDWNSQQVKGTYRQIFHELDRCSVCKIISETPFDVSWTPDSLKQAPVTPVVVDVKIELPSIMADGTVIGDPNEEKSIAVDSGKDADPVSDVLAAPVKPDVPVPGLILGHGIATEYGVMDVTGDGKVWVGKENPVLIVPGTIPDDVKPAIVLKQTQDDPEEDRIVVKGKPGRKPGRKPKK